MGMLGSVAFFAFLDSAGPLTISLFDTTMHTLYVPVDNPDKPLRSAAGTNSHGSSPHTATKRVILGFGFGS